MLVASPAHASGKAPPLATEFLSLSAHRNKRVRFTFEITSRDIRRVADRNEWRATYSARIFALCLSRT
jgi:hypothetical protein